MTVSVDPIYLKGLCARRASASTPPFPPTPDLIAYSALSNRPCLSAGSYLLSTGLVAHGGACVSMRLTRFKIQYASR